MAAAVFYRETHVLCASNDGVFVLKNIFFCSFFALQTKKAGKVFVIAGKCVILRANELTSSFNPAF